MIPAITTAAAGRRKRGTCLLRAQLRRQIFSADARRGLAGAVVQAFCPASPTKVFFGSSIAGAYAATGERYADSENAFAYRKALRADCTCNGLSPAGLASIDLAMDGSLRSGDALATADGLVAYSGIRVGNDQNPDFTPVASSPGRTPEVRGRLNDMQCRAGSSRYGGKQGVDFRGDPHAASGSDYHAEAGACA